MPNADMVIGDLPMLINYLYTNMAMSLYQEPVMLFVVMDFFMWCDVQLTHSQNMKH